MKHTYTFTCPTCRKLYRSDEPGEPCCTGPSESRDDHPMCVMRLVSVAKTDVDPRYAEKRAYGALIVPGMADRIDREVRILRV